ncbi:MAG: sigma-70 family RNA polymerase sigma factor [Planctomycetes bacterium]|nr:sigma-70 family RNA polymerase sigma factor [Planctomycetota bacterium]
MRDASVSRTHASLLARLQQEPNDESAWREFVARYGPRIKAWCLRWDLQESDAEEVTQRVLVQLAVKIRRFAYDPSKSFRAWLKTLTQHALSDFLDDRQRERMASGQPLTEAALEGLEARQDLEARLQEVFDLELLEEACRRVQERVEPRTWQAFELTTVQGLSGAEAAARLGMNVAAAFKAKNNVQKLLREELNRLEGADPP